jgi:hypothetical protein
MKREFIAGDRQQESHGHAAFGSSIFPSLVKPGTKMIAHFKNPPLQLKQMNEPVSQTFTEVQ